MASEPSADKDVGKRTSLTSTSTIFAMAGPLRREFGEVGAGCSWTDKQPIIIRMRKRLRNEPITARPSAAGTHKMPALTRMTIADSSRSSHGLGLAVANGA